MAVMASLTGYASPKSKLTTLIKSGELIRVKRNLYLPGNESDYSVMTLANIIYGHSYISFETALSYYNLIPETVYSIMSATYKKNKNMKEECQPKEDSVFSSIQLRILVLWKT